MNKQLTTTLLLAILMMASSCYFTSVDGNGNIQTTSREVSSFNAIQAGGSFNIIITQGDTEALSLEADENLHDIIDTYVKGNTLYIESTENIGRGTKKLYITVKELRDIDLSGAVELTCKNSLKYDQLNIESSGASDFSFDGYGQNLSIQCSGASEIELYGKADSAQISLSGASEIDAEEMKVKIMSLEMSGAGEAEVYVTQTLNVDISGAASVRYHGNPSVTKSISGAGSIRKAND